MRDSGHIVVCTCVKRRLNAKATSTAAAKRRYRQDAQQIDSRLRTSGSPSAFFTQQPASTIVVPSRFCMEAQSSERLRRSAVAIKPASLLVIDNLLLFCVHILHVECSCACTTPVSDNAFLI